MKEVSGEASKARRTLASRDVPDEARPPGCQPHNVICGDNPGVADGNQKEHWKLSLLLIVLHLKSESILFSDV